MFTGIIEAVGEVVALRGGGLVLAAGGLGSREDPVEIGESVAVNGCCLTVTEAGEGLRFDLSEETLARTSLGGLRAGSRVNLERAMRAGGRFGGHFVQGHVDATAAVVGIETRDDSTVFRFAVPGEYRRYVIDKGSVCLDGISLTAVRPEGEFEVWVIPHTLASTNLGDRRPGDRVNLEVDVLARYVERLLGPGPTGK